MIRFHIVIEACNFAGIQLLLAPKPIILIINEIGAWGLSQGRIPYMLCYTMRTLRIVLLVFHKASLISGQIQIHDVIHSRSRSTCYRCLCLPNDSAYTGCNDHYFDPKMRHIKFYAVQGYNCIILTDHVFISIDGMLLYLQLVYRSYSFKDLFQPHLSFNYTFY